MSREFSFSPVRWEHLWAAVLFLFFIGASRAGTPADSTGAVPGAPVVGKSPMGAVIRSALLPGLGQWYNEQRLKALIVFGGEAALVGNIFFYHHKAKESTVEENRLFYEDIKSRFSWILAAVHLLNMLDAYVDAHLFDFDAGPDLSLGIAPMPSGGMKVSLCIPLTRIGE